MLQIYWDCRIEPLYLTILFVGSNHSVAPPLLSSISQGGFTGKKFFFAQITAKAFSYIRTAFGASRSRRVGVRSVPN